VNRNVNTIGKAVTWNPS